MTLMQVGLDDKYRLEAKRIYETIQKENPASEAAQLATAKLQELK